MGQLQSRKGSRDERELQAYGQQQVVPSWAPLAAVSIREHRRLREGPAHTSGSSQRGFPAAAELERTRLMIDLMLPGEKARVAPFPMYRHNSEVWGSIVVTLVFPPPCSINLERTGEEPGEPHGKSSLQL